MVGSQDLEARIWWDLWKVILETAGKNAFWWWKCLSQQISHSVGTGKTFYPIEQTSLAMVITWAQSFMHLMKPAAVPLDKLTFVLLHTRRKPISSSLFPLLFISPQRSYRRERRTRKHCNICHKWTLCSCPTVAQGLKSLVLVYNQGNVQQLGAAWDVPVVAL